MLICCCCSVLLFCEALGLDDPVEDTLPGEASSLADAELDVLV
jgi:hypothetical protein